MKKILGLMFILNFLISCQLTSSKIIINENNIEKDSKANATFDVKVKNGICTNCDK